MSKLYYVYATMNSAKSTMLLTKAHSFSERDISFLCIKPSVDTRDSDGVIKSRIGIERECLVVDKIDNIYNIIEEYNKVLLFHGGNLLKWILVDEAQFLTREQVNQLSDIVDSLGINVMCFGLRTDFKTNLFEGSARLMELSDNIEELKSSCKCGRKAIVNARIDTFGNVVNSGEQIVIGGNDMYVPLCRKCYKEAINKMKY